MCSNVEQGELPNTCKVLIDLRVSISSVEQCIDTLHERLQVNAEELKPMNRHSVGCFVGLGSRRGAYMAGGDCTLAGLSGLSGILPKHSPQVLPLTLHALN